MTHFLKFTDETHWTTEATASGFIVTDPETSEERLQAYTQEHAIDVVGTIVDVPGVVLEEGEDLDDMTKQQLLDWALGHGNDLPDSWLKAEVKSACEAMLVTTYLDGWHVNYKGTLPEGWDLLEVFPTTPARVWF